MIALSASIGSIAEIESTLGEIYMSFGFEISFRVIMTFGMDIFSIIIFVDIFTGYTGFFCKICIAVGASINHGDQFLSIMIRLVSSSGGILLCILHSVWMLLSRRLLWRTAFFVYPHFLQEPSSLNSSFPHPGQVKTLMVDPFVRSYLLILSLHFTISCAESSLSVIKQGRSSKSQ
jgi:hypothetical protein